MELRNISLWFAKDESGEIITIDKIKDEYEGKYYCPLCGSEIIPKALNSVEVSPHFAHIDRSKCSGESIVHYWVKNELMKKDDVFEVVTDKSTQHMCKEILFEQSYETPYGIYKPDITVITYKNEKIFIEVNNTNKKKIEDYYLKWQFLECCVIEFGIDSIYDGGENKVNISNTFKAIYYKDMCYNIDKNDKDYIVYRDSVFSKVPSNIVDRLRKIEWFIDDIYKYNNKIIDIKDISNSFLLLINKEYKSCDDLVTFIYRAKRCQSSMSDIVKYIFDYIHNEIKNLAKENNISIKSTMFDISTNRLISDRIFSTTNIEVEVCNIEINNIKYKIEDVFKYDTYKDIISHRNFVKFVGLDKFNINFTSNYYVNIHNIAINGLETYSDNICKNFGVYLEKVKEINDMDLVLNKAYNNMKFISTGEYVDVDSINKYILNTISNLDLDEYINLQKTYISKDRLDLDKVLNDVMFDIRTESINGVRFFKVKDIGLDLIRNSVEVIISNHKNKYYERLKKCRILNDNFSGVKCYSGFIEFYYNQNVFYIYDDKLVYGDYNIATVEWNDDVCTSISNVINSLKNEKSVYNVEIVEICNKIKNIYLNLNKSYSISSNTIGISLYRSDRYGNNLSMISYYKFNENTSYGDILDKFSSDVRCYLYGGNN